MEMIVKNSIVHMKSYAYTGPRFSPWVERAMNRGKLSAHLSTEQWQM